jgi:hypothetical protein
MIISINSHLESDGCFFVYASNPVIPILTSQARTNQDTNGWVHSQVCVQTNLYEGKKPETQNKFINNITNSVIDANNDANVINPDRIKVAIA